MKAKLKSIKTFTFIFSLLILGMIFPLIRVNAQSQQFGCLSSNSSINVDHIDYNNQIASLDLSGCIAENGSFEIAIVSQGSTTVLKTIGGLTMGDFDESTQFTVPLDTTHLQIVVRGVDKDTEPVAQAANVRVPGKTDIPTPENQNINLINSFTGGVGSESQVSATFDTPAKLVNLIVRNLFTLAGILLFINILWAGFKFINQGAKGKDEAKSIMTVSIVGFIIMFTAYWIVQIIGIVTGTEIIGL